MREICGVKEADDGLFWMSLDDMQKYFGKVQVCNYVDANEFSSAPQQGRLGIFKFDLEKEGTYTVSFSQKDEKMFPRGTQYSYSDMRFFVFRVEEPDDDPTDYLKLWYSGGCCEYFDRDKHLEIKV